MGHFVEGADRDQASFLPARLEDYVAPDNPVRVIDAFVDERDLAELGFARVQPAATGRPGYAPSTMLKLYVYGYLHQLTSSRKLEREGRNIELMWLMGKLVPTSRSSRASAMTTLMQSRSHASALSPSVVPLAWSAAAWSPSARVFGLLTRTRRTTLRASWRAAKPMSRRALRAIWPSLKKPTVPRPARLRRALTV